MAVFNNNLLAGAGAQSSDSTYKINQSIRFNASDYPKMTRTPSSAGNRRTFTFSTWIKRGALSTDQVVFGSYINTTNYFLIYFDSTNHSTDNTFRVYEYNGNVLKFWVYGTQKFRDPSAWYHFVVSVDTTNAVSNERIRLYVNGSRITDLTQNQQPSLNYETYINSTNLQTIGEFYGNYYHFDGYMAEMHLLDGYAYDPSFFGETNSNGIWVPKEYTGSYGTNGFKIDGRDSSDLGDDESGQGNDYTTSGLASNDQMSDSPTTNWCVMNPLLNNGCTYTNGNLEVAPPNLQSTHRLVLPTMGILPSDTNKYYWEITYLASDNSSSVNMLGIGGVDNPNNPASATLNGGGDGYGLGYSTFTSNIYAGANWTANGSPTWSGGFTASAVYGVAYDGSTKRLYFYENNSALNSGNHFATYTGSAPLGPGASLYTSPSSSKLIFNMGANGFTYTPPTGYVAVNTTNLGS